MLGCPRQGTMIIDKTGRRIVPRSHPILRKSPSRARGNENTARKRISGSKSEQVLRRGLSR
jgi:hypothetical protein